jgi:hypothetical protein
MRFLRALGLVIAFGLALGWVIHDQRCRTCDPLPKLRRRYGL